VCAEVNTVLRAVAADFFFNCWYLEIPSDNHISHVPMCVHCHAQGFPLETFWNFYVGNRIHTPGLYSVSSDWFEYCFIRGSLLLDESFDLHPSNQYMLVRVAASCFRFAEMCLCRVSLLSRCSPRYLTSSSWGSCTLYMWRGALSFRVVNVTWIDLHLLALIPYF
jgi:hypothetical protein